MFWAWKSLSRRWHKWAPATLLAPSFLSRCPQADPESVLLLGHLLCVGPFFRPSVLSLPYFQSESSDQFCTMVAMGRTCTGCGLPSPWTQSELPDLPPEVSLFHSGCYYSLGMPSRAHPIPFPSAGSMPGALPSSAEPWLSRACSDVQKFLPPNHGWMRIV